MTREQLAQILERQPVSPLDLLDNEEMEAFSILSRGGGASQICREMGVSEAHAEEIKTSILGKLKLKDSFALMQFAARQKQAQY